MSSLVASIADNAPKAQETSKRAAVFLPIMVIY
jgi:hypothetical protein